MNKKILTIILGAVLIIVLAIIVGINLSKDNSKPANTQPYTPISTPATVNTDMKTPEVETSATQETETPEPTATATPEINNIKDISSMSGTEKEEYAKELARASWEKMGAGIKVNYNIDDITSDGEYIISVRNEGTVALKWYKVNINKGTCEEY